MNNITKYLSSNLDHKRSSTNDWFEAKILAPHRLLYSSVDIRCSGQKIAPVDANIYPAGFNNLSEPATKYAKELLEKYFTNFYPLAGRIIILAESHTRNKFYIDNLLAIKKIFSQLNCEVHLTTLNEQELLVESSTDEQVTLEPILNFVNNKNDIIILNNDLTEGVPDFIKDSKILTLPPFETGWYQRKKTLHFSYYNEIVEEFSNEFGIDSFYLTTMFQNCNDVNFKTISGLECIALKVEKMLHSLREKYSEHGIKQQPYLVVKSNSGTYGMAIMIVSSGNEIIAINKKGRNKMHAGKSGSITDNVVIQEGIETLEQYNNNIAESMIYSVAAKPVSFIYRSHPEKDTKSNLNSSGMIFNEIDYGEQNSELYYHYLVAKLTNLAIIKEIDYYENLEKK